MEPILELKHINAGYDGQQALFDVSLALPAHRIIGLVGESGSGKSTVARVIAGLLKPDSGQVLLHGAPLAGRRDRDTCRKIQMVFQNPEGSLNPRRKIGRTIADAMLFHGVARKEDVRQRCAELLRRMELPEDSAERLPRSFSGGQKQRIALARALCVGPELLIADEPTSALDVSVQRRMLDLIREVRQEGNLTVLFISHDLGVIRYLCDDVVVLRGGRVVEQDETGRFFAAPQTEYARTLLDSVPRLSLDGVME